MAAKATLSDEANLLLLSLSLGGRLHTYRGQLLLAATEDETLRPISGEALDQAEESRCLTINQNGPKVTPAGQRAVSDFMRRHGYRVIGPKTATPRRLTAASLKKRTLRAAVA